MKKKTKSAKKTKKPHGLPETIYAYWSPDSEKGGEFMECGTAAAAAERADDRPVGVYRLDGVVQVESETSVTMRPWNG